MENVHTGRRKTDKATDQTITPAGESTHVIGEADVSCTACGMPKYEWTENQGKGVAGPNGIYCCEGCAAGIGCDCQ